MLTTIGCDRITKHVARTKLAGTPTQSFFAGALQFEYTENTGAFLSLGSRLPEWARGLLLRGGVGLALVTLALIAMRHRWSGLALTGAGLIFAGGLSNLLDRVTQGSVVDFMSVGIGRMRTGIFNVADIGILLGVLLLVFRRSQDSR
jgi:signal peptidase II